MYTTGLLFCLIGIYHLSSWIFSNENKYSKDYWFGIIGIVLASYNHHFALLSMGIAWLSLWLILPKTLNKKYSFIPLFCAIGYAPIAPMTYAQVTIRKGLSWMEQKPTWDYIIDFFQYIFHYNTFYLIVLTAIAIYTVFIKRNIPKIVLIGFGWFVISYIIIFSYSYFLSPLIQFHPFIFTLPYVIILISFSIKNIIPQKALIVAIGVVFFVGLTTLHYTRKHFELFPKMSFATSFEITQNELETLHDDNKALIITSLNKTYHNHYFNQLNGNESLDVIHLADSLGIIKNANPDINSLTLNDYQKIILVNTPYYYTNVCLKQNFEITDKDYGYFHEIYILNKKENSAVKKQKTTWISSLQEGNEEWGPSITVDEIQQRNIIVEHNLTNQDTIILVLELKDKITNQLAQYHKRIIGPSTNNQTTIKSTFHIEPENQTYNNLKGTFYFWNINKTQYAINQANIIWDTEESHTLLKPQNRFKEFKTVAHMVDSSYALSLTFSENEFVKDRSSYLYCLLYTSPSPRDAK